MDNKNIDPWLYPGCICEVWDEGQTDNEHVLRYYETTFANGQNLFCRKKGRYPTTTVYDHYRPINTPWDYAPADAVSIKIQYNKMCYFYDKYGGMINYICKPYSVLWHNCPDCLIGETLSRPGWATYV